MARTWKREGIAEQEAGREALSRWCRQQEAVAESKGGG